MNKLPGHVCELVKRAAGTNWRNYETLIDCFQSELQNICYSFLTPEEKNQGDGIICN